MGLHRGSSGYSLSEQCRREFFQGIDLETHRQTRRTYRSPLPLSEFPRAVLWPIVACVRQAISMCCQSFRRSTRIGPSATAHGMARSALRTLGKNALSCFAFYRRIGQNSSGRSLMAGLLWCLGQHAKVFGGKWTVSEAGTIETSAFSTIPCTDISFSP